MKIVAIHDLLNPDRFVTSSSLAGAWQDVEKAIHATDWPHGSGQFSIYPESGKKRGQGNGVKPIKIPCMDSLSDSGWLIENLPYESGGVLKTGDLDAVIETDEGHVLFEWETGNISSSHRAINKLLLTLQTYPILGGIMTVPSDKLKPYLTDRIGNIGELIPYFPLWRSITGTSGGFRIVVIEHDNLSMTVPRIPKTTDGRALV